MFIIIGIILIQIRGVMLVEFSTERVLTDTVMSMSSEMHRALHEGACTIERVTAVLPTCLLE